MTVAELAEGIGASRRTVLRDIGALRDEGFVIHSEPGRGGGLQLDPQSLQTTARLSVAEVFALVVSVTSMRAAGGLPFGNFANAGLAKIEAALPPDKLRDLRRFSIACSSGYSRPRWIFRTWGRWMRHCCRLSRRHFWSGAGCALAIAMPRGLLPRAMSNRRPC
jgi:hypothetical protein